LIPNAGQNIYGLAVDSLGPGAGGSSGGSGSSGGGGGGDEEDSSGYLGTKTLSVDDTLNGRAKFFCESSAQAGKQCVVNGSFFQANRPQHPKRAKAKKVGKVSGTVPVGETGEVPFKLKKSMRKVLAKGPAKLTLSGTITNGDGGTTPFKRKLKIKLGN
jgi:hypothetical protein